MTPPTLVARLREFADKLVPYQDTYAAEEVMLREAADTLEARERRYNAIRAHLLRRHGCDFGEPDYDPLDNEAIPEPEADAAEVERDLTAHAHRLAEEKRIGRAIAHQLSTAQAEIARLREALDYIASGQDTTNLGGVRGIARAALASAPTETQQR